MELQITLSLRGTLQAEAGAVCVCSVTGLLVLENFSFY